MDPIITLNVGGRCFQTYRSTLKKFPETMLARCFESGLAKLNDKGEYFFDRNASMFEAILDIYRTGNIYCPPTLDLDAFNEELRFWGFEALSRPNRSVTDVCRLEKLIGLCLSDCDYSLKHIIKIILDKIIAAIDANMSKIVVVNRPQLYIYFGHYLETEYFTFSKVEKVEFQIKETHDPNLSWRKSYYALLNDDIYHLSSDLGEIPAVSGQIQADGTYVKPEIQGIAYICTL